MAVYDIGLIRAAIKALLTSVSSLSKVYDFQQSVIEGYPAAIFELDNEDAQMLDDTSNQRVLSFKIWIVTELPTEGIQAAKDLLDSVTRDVINALEKKTNLLLSGTADWTMPVIGARSQTNSPEGNYLYQELMLKVYVVSTIL